MNFFRNVLVVLGLTRTTVPHFISPYNAQSLREFSATNDASVPCNRYVEINPGMTVIVESPNFPYHYIESFYCLRTIVSKVYRSTLELQCSANFSIVSEKEHCWKGDFLRIWELSHKKSKYYCEDDPPPVIETSTRVLNVGFYSNYKETSSGFSCEVTAKYGSSPTLAPKPRPRPRPPLPKPNPTTCGTRVIDESLIDSSESEVMMKEFPWIVALRNKNNFEDLCGGTLISNSLVLTSSSCIQRMSINETEALLGTLDYSSTAEDSPDALVVPLSWIKVHPQYENEDLRNDIALVKLVGEEVLLSSDSIQPICLPSRDYTADDGIIAGWQSFPWAPEIQDELEKKDLTILDFSLCDMFITSIQLQNSTVCGFTNGESGTCRLDSGGPLMISKNGTFYLYGTASFVPDCRESTPAFFTKVSSFLEWISDNSSE